MAIKPIKTSTKRLYVVCFISVELGVLMVFICHPTKRIQHVETTETIIGSIKTGINITQSIQTFVLYSSDSIIKNLVMTVISREIIVIYEYKVVFISTYSINKHHLHTRYCHTHQHSHRLSTPYLPTDKTIHSMMNVS